jgi:hypothetical protein
MGRYDFLEKRKMSIIAYKRNDSRVIYADIKFNGRRWIARLFERGFKKEVFAGAKDKDSLEKKVFDFAKRF